MSKINGVSNQSSALTNGTINVIIIGSGMSGICAARQLADQTNFDITVLEANPDRWGGRIWTYEVPGYPGQPVELGAQWLHGGAAANHPVKQIALQYAIPLLKNDAEREHEETLTFDLQGKLLSNNDIPSFAERLPELLDEMRENLVQTNSSDISYEKALDTLKEKYLKEMQDPFIKYIQIIGMESLNAATVDQMSLIYVPGVPNNTDIIEYDGYDLVSPNGYRHILDSLVSGGRGFRVELGRKVETVKYSINDSDGRVELTTVNTKTNETNVYHADYVIVAVPLGVLKANQIQFSPNLPMDKIKAIENLGFGNFVKVLMVFDQPFWPDKKFIVTETETGLPFFFVNNQRINKLPALTAIVISHGAVTADALPENELIEQVMARVKIMFGSETVQNRKLLHTKVTRWRNDPLIRGSYSFGKFGMTSEDAYNIRTPIKPHLFFAGEHTTFPENQQGTVHGAYLSGIRVAKELVQWHKLLRSVPKF